VAGEAVLVAGCQQQEQGGGVQAPHAEQLPFYLKPESLRYSLREYGIAYAVGIKPGDLLLAINGHFPSDF